MGVKKMTPFFWVENRESFGFFFYFEPKKCFRLHAVCMGRRWDERSCRLVSALFSHFCYVGGFGELGDPVVPTLRGVSGDVVTVYAY